MTPKYTEIAYLRMSGLTYREIGEKYDLSPERIRQIILKYFRRCKSTAEKPYTAEPSEHPNIDIIKSIYEDKDDDNTKRK
jgi:hypothetical protein